MKPDHYCLGRLSYWQIAVLCFMATGAVLGAQNSVVVWGGGAVANVPADVTNVASVATGNDCVALLRDGRLRKWGSANTNVPPAATNVVAVSAEATRFVAVRRDGLVVDQQGVIRASNAVAAAVAEMYGAGAVKSNGVFVSWDGLWSPPASTSNAVALAKAGYATLRVLLADGTVTPVPSDLSAAATGVVAMAEGAYPVFLKGDGTVISSGTQSGLLASLSNVVAVASGFAHGVALRSDGSVIAWGSNSSGQTNVPAGLANVVSIAAGGSHSLALKADGAVVAWGNNTSGQTNVPTGLTNAYAIFAGTSYSVAIVGESPPVLLAQPRDQTTWSGPTVSLAVTASGSLPLHYQWQYNGEIIEGATNRVYRIDTTAAENSGIYNVVVSNRRGTVVSRNVTVLIWPDPNFSQQPTNQMLLLGQTATFRALASGSKPVSYQWYFEDTLLSGATNTVLSVTNTALAQAGRYWVVASHAGGVCTSSVAVFNPLVIAEWGARVGLSSKLPVEVLEVAGIASGGNNNFLIKPDGTGLFWGQDDYVWPGMQITGYVSNIVALAPGHQFFLALLTNGTIAERGFVDISHGFNLASLSDVVGISVGSLHALALKADGTVVAWGDDWEGSTQVPPGLTGVVSVAAGGLHSMALRADGSIAVWGDNQWGQTNSPPGLTNTVAIAAGGHHSLALKGDGRVVAWGNNTYGQTNVPAGLSHVIAIAAGFSHSLALRADGTVAAWGDNSSLQIAIPAQLRNVVAISAGHSHNMALLAEGLVAPSVHCFNATRNYNGFSLQIPTVRGRTYYLQYRDSLTDPDWCLLPPVPGDGSVKTLHDPTVAASQRFYRVWQKP